MIPVLLTHPSQVPAIFTNLYMERAVYFVKLYFPLFLLGAVLGKLMEISGFARSIVAALIQRIGHGHTIVTVVLISALLTYGGVSLFVVVFAVYPFAAEMFRFTNIPKRLIPATLALGAFSFTMDALPGTPQIQNIIPTTFFRTTAWAAPRLGIFGSILIFVTGVAYLQWRARLARDEGYGTNHENEPEMLPMGRLPNPFLALLPLLAVGICNWAFGRLIPRIFGNKVVIALPGLDHSLVADVPALATIWSLEAALLVAILLVCLLACRSLAASAGQATKPAVSGALLACMNTASEYGFGAVIAALPGFIMVRDATSVIANPLVNAAVSTTTLAGITGSASGGLSIALAAMSTHFIAMSKDAGIPLEVLHRITAMASGGMDMLPHNGAVITVFAVTGLTHRQSYRDIFAITLLKTIAVFITIGFYYLTHWI